MTASPFRRGDERLKVALRALITALVWMTLILSISAAPAQAFSTGASTDCRTTFDRECVSGFALAESAGTSSTGATAAVVCVGVAPAAAVTEVSCVTDHGTKSGSFDGPGAVTIDVPSVPNTNRLTVCWEVTGHFTSPGQPVRQVATSDCSQIEVSVVTTDREVDGLSIVYVSNVHNIIVCSALATPDAVRVTVSGCGNADPTTMTGPFAAAVVAYAYWPSEKPVAIVEDDLCFDAEATFVDTDVLSRTICEVIHVDD